MTSNNPFPKGHKINVGRKFSKEIVQKRIETRRKNGWLRNPEKSLKKMRLAQMGNKNGVGHKCSEEIKRKFSRERKGSKGSNWKGGVTPEHKRLRNSLEWKVWRTAVFERDKYFCQMCGMHSKYLRPHHIKFFSEYPKLRFEVSNGITLCDPCHRFLHRYLRRIKKLQWEA